MFLQDPSRNDPWLQWRRLARRARMQWQRRRRSLKRDFRTPTSRIGWTSLELRSSHGIRRRPLALSYIVPAVLPGGLGIALQLCGFRTSLRLRMLATHHSSKPRGPNRRTPRSPQCMTHLDVLRVYALCSLFAILILYGPPGSNHDP